MTSNSGQSDEFSTGKLAGTMVAGTSLEVGSRLTSRFNRRNLLSTLIGASVGFGIGVAFHMLWRSAMDFYSRRNDTDRLMMELINLKRELMDMRELLNSTEDRQWRTKQLEPIPPFYLSDEEDENFQDIDDEHSSAEDFCSALPGDRLSSNVTSFHTVPSYASSKQAPLRLGPALPETVSEELDQLAQLAMGDFPSISSTPKVDAAGDESKLGTQAYSRCLVYRHKYRRTPEFLWRFARATFLASEDLNNEEDFSALNDVGDTLSDANSTSSRSFDPRSPNDWAYDLTTRRQFIETGLGLARRALRLASYARQEKDSTVSDTCLAETYKWLAVMVGLACDFGGMQQRITYGHEFKTLIDRAVELQPGDALGHYLKGRWCYQVYNLTWIERQFASRLFATPPTATLEEAESEFQEVEALRPNFYAANQLYLAKCFISKSDYVQAGIWLNRAKAVMEQRRAPSPHVDTASVREEIDILINKYSAYF